jgi:2,4-dienoyl-CoA reductase-like NADH-dependent reductase (Old Yellow Enzyme family)
LNLDTPICIGKLEAANRLVMPPMATNKTDHGLVTAEQVQYYRERALYSRPGIIITEHSCIAESGRASERQLSIAADELIAEHRKLTDVIHEGGSLAFVQLNHAGSKGIGEAVSASNVGLPMNNLTNSPRELTTGEIQEIEALFASAAVRAIEAGYDGIEIHCAHGYLLNQFYSPMTNKRSDAYGGSLENRLRFMLETVALVREAIGTTAPIAVRLGGADYLPGGSSEEDAVEAGALLEAAGVDLIDLSGGMCFFSRPGHSEAGYFSTMSEKVKTRVSVPVLLTGGVQTVSDAEKLLLTGKTDLIGVGRALMKDARWRENAQAGND